MTKITVSHGWLTDFGPVAALARACSAHADHKQAYRSVIFTVHAAYLDANFVVMLGFKFVYAVFYDIFHLLFLANR